MQQVTIQEMGLINPMIVPGNYEYQFIKDNLIRTRKKNRKVWRHIPHPEHGKKVLIDYSNIPLEHKERLKLPLEYTEFKQGIKELQEQKQSVSYYGGNAQTFLLSKEIEKYVEQNYLKYISGYAATCNNNFKIAELNAREHALRLGLVAYSNSKDFNKVQLHEVHLQKSKTGTQNNYCKFTNLLRHQWTTSEGVSLIHGSKGAARPDKVKMTDTHILLIEELYKHPNQYSHALITEMLNRQCKKDGLPEVVRRTVSAYLQQPEVYNRLLMFRNKEAYGKKVKPINRRIGAENGGDLYYMDGSPLQISCLNREGTKEIRPTLFVVLDSHSRKITGFCIAETEDRYTWIGAMKMAAKMENALPAEWVYDNASATGTPEFIALNERLLLAGSKLRPAKPGEPTAKAQVERWFGSFQSGYQRMIDGFVGEGIRSKRETGRIDAEFLKKVRKQNGVLTFDSLTEITSFLIAAYNQKGTPKHPNPNKKMADSCKPNMIALQPEKMALLFWNNRPITIRNSEVKMTVRHTEYFYSVNDYTLNGQTVKVFYDESDLSSIHLFDNTEQYLCEVEQKVLFHEATVNQTQKDVNQILGQTSHNKAVERKLKTDGKNKTAKARAEFGDDLLKILNPLEMLKDDFNNAETERVLEYIRDNNSIDRMNVTPYSPVNNEEETGGDFDKRYSKKHTVRKPSLAIVGEV